MSAGAEAVKTAGGDAVGRAADEAAALSGAEANAAECVEFENSIASHTSALDLPPTRDRLLRSSSCSSSSASPQLPTKPDRESQRNIVLLFIAVALLVFVWRREPPGDRGSILVGSKLFAGRDDGYPRELNRFSRKSYRHRPRLVPVIERGVDDENDEDSNADLDDGAGSDESPPENGGTSERQPEPSSKRVLLLNGRLRMRRGMQHRAIPRTQSERDQYQGPLHRVHHKNSGNRGTRGASRPTSGKAGFDYLLDMDHKQQKQLNNEYWNMMRTDDPDVIDKQMQNAWRHMRDEDVRVLKQTTPAVVSEDGEE
eukprot:g4042.t1